jgi:hypothetical protein
MPPILRCRNEHPICSKCANDLILCPICQDPYPEPKPRSRLLEDLIELHGIKLACRNDCGAEFSTEAQCEEHLPYCLRRLNPCIISNCQATHRSDGFRRHLLDDHDAPQMTSADVIRFPFPSGAARRNRISCVAIVDDTVALLVQETVGVGFLFFCREVSSIPNGPRCKISVSGRGYEISFTAPSLPMGSPRSAERDARSRLPLPYALCERMRNDGEEIEIIVARDVKIQ